MCGAFFSWSKSVRLSARVIVVCLEASEPALLKRWSKRGKLPVFNRLESTGQLEMIQNYQALGAGVFWPSVFSGAQPSQHGRYFLFQPRPGTHEVAEFDQDEGYGVAPLWDDLDRVGRKTFAMDVHRMACSPAKFGVRVADWLAHDPISEARSNPPEVLQDLREKYGSDPYEESLARLVSDGMDLEEVIDRTRTRIETKTQACVNALTSEDWDLFVTTIPEPHDVGHYLWHVHERIGEEEDDPSSESEDPLLRTYEMADEAVTELFNAAGSDAVRVVIAGPGMQRRISMNCVLDKMLRRIEFGATAPASVTATLPLRLYRRVLPKKLRTFLLPISSRLKESLRDKDYQSRAYRAVPHNDNAGAIRISLAGRDGDGQVSPGNEYESICRSLTEALLEIVDMDTGLPVVARVVRPREYLESGPRMQDLPDLFVVWNRSGDCRRLSSPRIGELEIEDPSPRTGDHTSDGLILVNGTDSDIGLSSGSIVPHEVRPILEKLLGMTATGCRSLSDHSDDTSNLERDRPVVT